MNRRELLIGTAAIGAAGTLATPAAAVMPFNGWPGLALHPDDRNVGYLADPNYPGSLTPHDGKALVPNTLYKYIDFDGVVVNVDGVRFRGCRFASNWVDGWNVKLANPGATDTLFRFCTFEPSAIAAPPHAAWPSAGARENVYGGAVSDYMIPRSKAYQYGVLQTNGRLLMEDCDIWGFGNAIVLFGSDEKVIRRCWIHDAAHQGPNVEYHQDGIGHLDNIGCSNVLIEYCTIASLGNTNGIAFQAGTYSNIVVRRNFLSGFGCTIDMGHNTGANNNLIFKDNTIATDVGAYWGPLYADFTSSFSKESNKWERNVLRVAKDTVPRAGAWSFSSRDHYWFVHPDGSLHHQDYES